MNADEGGERRFTREEFVAGGVGVAIASGLAGYGLSRLFLDSGTKEIVLRPRPETVELGGRRVSTWTFGDGVPGPELRVKQGERLRVRVENGLPEETTIHWHGVRVPNAMDGVPDMTQKPIRTAESFVYEFAPPDAGTLLVPSPRRHATRPRPLGASAATPEGATVVPSAGHTGVVGAAMSELGTPYSWGGASPGGFDCSGLVAYAYGKEGVSLPHSSYALWNVGRPVARDQLEPGDLVFFNGLGHMGMYVGGGSFIRAPHTGDVVKISSLNGPYGSSYVGARRVVGGSSS